MLAPSWALEKLADHAVDFWLMTEDLPDAGQPRSRSTATGTITLSYTAHQPGAERQALRTSSSRCSASLDMHEHLIPRNIYLKNDIGVAGVAHQSGTCRFGTDPKTSVLDANCKAHELDNLYVVDTSFFPSIGAVNPALTAMANAIRVGDHLLERLK